MDSPDIVLPDSLVTVPDTVTVPFGRATCGLTESMTTDAALPALCCRAVAPARAAGATASRQAPAAAKAAAITARVTVARMNETRRGTLTGHA